MYFADKKITKIGTSSLGVILPREWLFTMGLSKKGESLRMMFDPVTHRIYIDVHPNGPDALTRLNGAVAPTFSGTTGHQNKVYNAPLRDPNDYTPQPRQTYPPSPHPQYTPAQWAKIPEGNKSFMLNRLDLERQYREIGLNPDSEADINKFNALQKQARVLCGLFEELPDHPRQTYEQLRPSLYFIDAEQEDNARREWVTCYNVCVLEPSAARRQELTRELVNNLKNTYRRYGDDKYDDLDEL